MGLFLAQGGQTSPVIYQDYIDAQNQAGFLGVTPMTFGSSRTGVR
jgi:hypothetical protein